MNSLTSHLPLVCSVATSAWDPIWSQRDHVNPDAELVHIVKGSVMLHLAGRRYTARSGDTLLIPPGMEHRDAFAPGTPFEVLHIVFRWPAAVAQWEPQINSRLFAMKPAEKHIMRRLVTDVHDDFRQTMNIAPNMTGASLLRVLVFIDTIASAPASIARPAATANDGKRRSRQIMEQTREHIRQNLGRPITLTSIATELNVSPFHLCHVFSRENGFTLSSFLLQERMRKAAELLADPGRRVAQTAYSVGFEDPNYFGKVFRKYFGMTPGQYRAQLHERSRNKSL